MTITTVSDNIRRNGEQTEVRIGAILRSKVALRDVNRDSDKYLGLVESIKNKGVLQPILVRETSNEFGRPAFGLVDGLQRFTAAGDAGLDWIPANIKNMEEGDVLDAQLITNLHKIETKPIEYTKHLLRILASNPLMSEKELAERLSVTEAYIKQRLSLDKLRPEIAELVDSGKIILMNAYALSRLDQVDQGEFVDRAMTDDPKVFVPTVNQRIKQVKDAAKAGKDAAGPQPFEPVPHLRKVSELKTEWENSVAASAVLAAAKAATAADGWAAALSWALNMDPASVAEQLRKDEERKQKREAERDRLKVEREQKKAQAAAERAGDIMALPLSPSA